jgi:glutamate--cysteine ligase
MSDLGYRNTTQAGPGISANSLTAFVTELRAATSTPDPAFAAIGVAVDGEYRQLNANVLQIESEYYSSIRPKPRDRGLRPVAALERDGVEYVELRNLDSDPTALVGIGTLQMRVAELLLLLCLLQDSPPIVGAEQAEIDSRELAVAWEGRRPGLTVVRNGARVALADWGYELADQLAALGGTLGGDYPVAAERVRRLFESPAETPAAKMLETLASRRLGLLDYGLELAEAHRATFAAYAFPPGREASLEAAAAASLEAARLQADARQRPFAEYLADYFTQ